MLSSAMRKAKKREKKLEPIYPYPVNLLLGDHDLVLSRKIRLRLLDLILVLDLLGGDGGGSGGGGIHRRRRGVLLRRLLLLLLGDHLVD